MALLIAFTCADEGQTGEYYGSNVKVSGGIVKGEGEQCEGRGGRSAAGSLDEMQRNKKMRAEDEG